MLHPVVIRHHHHEVYSLTPELQSPAAARNSDRGRSAPSAVFRPASGDSFTVTSPESDSDFHHGRNHSDALRIFHHFVRNRFIRSCHDLFENIGGRFEPFVDIR